jgi:hypothetical protein
MGLQNISPVEAGEAERRDQVRPTTIGYAFTPRARKVAGSLRAQASALQAFRVVAPGGGSPPPRRALKRLVAEAVARVRVVVAALRADGAEELEQHLRAELLAALSPDAGGPDEAA